MESDEKIVRVRTLDEFDRELARYAGERPRKVELDEGGGRLDPGLDPRRQPLHRRPAPAADAEPEAQADEQGPEPSLEQEGSHPTGRDRRIALDGTQRVARDAPGVLAEPLELARRQFLDGLAFALQPSPQSLGQVVRV